MTAMMTDPPLPRSMRPTAPRQRCASPPRPWPRWRRFPSRWSSRPRRPPTSATLPEVVEALGSRRRRGRDHGRGRRRGVPGRGRRGQRAVHLAGGSRAHVGRRSTRRVPTIRSTTDPRRWCSPTMCAASTAARSGRMRHPLSPTMVGGRARRRRGRDRHARAASAPTRRSSRRTARRWPSRGVAGADLVSARPGFSEHQSGHRRRTSSPATAAAARSTTSPRSPQGAWLAEHAWEFGWIVRYEDGYTADHGLPARAVAPALHRARARARLPRRRWHTLEEFFGLPPAPDYVG